MEHLGYLFLYDCVFFDPGHLDNLDDFLVVDLLEVEIIKIIVLKVMFILVEFIFDVFKGLNDLLHFL